MKLTKEMYDAEDSYCKKTLGYSMGEYLTVPYIDEWNDYGERLEHPLGYTMDDYMYLEVITEKLEYCIENLPENVQWKTEVSDRTTEVKLPSETAEVQAIKKRIKELGDQIHREIYVPDKPELSKDDRIEDLNKGYMRAYKEYKKAIQAKNRKIRAANRPLQKEIQELDKELEELMTKSGPVTYLYAPYRLPYPLLDNIAEAVGFSSDVCGREHFEEIVKDFDFMAGMAEEVLKAGGYTTVNIL